MERGARPGPSGVSLVGLSAALSGLHYAMWDSPITAWLAVIAYAPFLIWVACDCKRPFLAGLGLGIWRAIFNTFWLGQFAYKWTENALLAAMVPILIGVAWGACYGLGFLIAARLKSSRMIMVALLLGLSEVIRTGLPELEFPFAMIGEPLIVYSVLPIPLWLVSPLVCWLNGVAAIAVTNAWDSVNRVLLIATALAFAALCGAPLLAGEAKLQRSLNFRIAQLGVDLAYAPAEVQEQTIQLSIDKVIQTTPPETDVVLFPEAILNCADTVSVPDILCQKFECLTGVKFGPVGGRVQGVVLSGPSSLQVTEKRKLVVFGEYVPFRGVIPYPESLKLPTGDFVPGTKRRILNLKNGTKVGALICFESLFWGASKDLKEKGAELITVHSLDDWYAGTNAIPRLITATCWRAAETKTPILRVTSRGRSCLIDRRGRIIARTTTDNYQVIDGTLPAGE